MLLLACAEPQPGLQQWFIMLLSQGHANHNSLKATAAVLSMLLPLLKHKNNQSCSKM